MKKSMKLTACALSAALALQCTIPAFAAGNAVKKDENVFVTLAGDGTVKSQTVSDWLHADGGLAGVGDASLLTDIVNLKGKEEPEKKGEKLLWNMQDADVYYWWRE